MGARLAVIKSKLNDGYDMAMKNRDGRAVFFVPGFDRRSPDAFWRRQRASCAKAARGGAAPILLGAPAQAGDLWRWDYQTGERRCDFALMDWSDLVRDRFATGALRQILDGLAILGIGLATGFWWRALRRGGGLAQAILIGFVPLLLTILLIGIAAFWPLTLVFCAPALFWARQTAPRYIQHIAWGARAIACGKNAAFEQRIAQHAQTLAACCANGGQAVLVGHSLGAAMALRIWVAAGAPQNCKLVFMAESLALVADQSTHFWRELQPKLAKISVADSSMHRDPLVFARRAVSGLEIERFHEQALTGPRQRAYTYRRRLARHYRCFEFAQTGATHDMTWRGLLFPPLPVQHRDATPRPKRAARA